MRKKRMFKYHFTVSRRNLGNFGGQVARKRLKSEVNEGENWKSEGIHLGNF